MREHSRVLVVGAGPVGAAIAYLLASRGVETTLLERQTDFAREFRGEVMTPGGVDAVRQMGLADELDEVPHQVPTTLSVHAEGRLVIELEVQRLFQQSKAMIVSQPHLLEQFVARASALPSFSFGRGVAVRGLVHESDRVVGVRAQTDAGERTLRADLVIGTDGRASVVRRDGGFAREARDLPMDVVWCKLPWPKIWQNDRPVHAWLAGGHLLIALPAPDGLLQVAWVILKGTFRELREHGIEEWVRQMAMHVDDELGRHLLAHVGDLSRPFLLDAQADRVLGWARPGVLVLGDAAHTMSPVGAQGINVALRDAIVAANHLVPALRAHASSDGIDAAARRIEPERGPEIDTIQRLAAQPPRVVLSRGALAGALRRALPLLARIPGLGLAVAPIARSFAFGTTSVELRV